MITHGAFKRGDGTGEQQATAWQSLLQCMVVIAALLIVLCSCADTNIADIDVRGAPTLTASFINQVLAQAGSPAQGLGDTLYALSEQYHIDDAVALAFFHHESGYGEHGVARSTQSLGNIRCTSGYRCDPTGAFRSYSSWKDGAADWYKLIATVYLSQGLTTVSSIIPVYAPQSDHNNESAYINSVLTDISHYQQGEN